MKKKNRLIALSLTLMLSSALGQKLHAQSAASDFIQNKGQITDDQGNLRPDILYNGSAGGAKIYLTKSGISQGYRIKNLAVYQDIRDSTLHLI
jgi:hypothetical protein